MTYSNLINMQIDKNENEKLFQDAWDNNDWETIWYCCFRCNYNIVKSYYKQKGIIIDNEELLEIVTDATCYCIKFYSKGIRPQKLSSYNYLRCIRFITNPKKVWEEQNITQFPVDSNGKEIEYGRSK